MGDTRQRLLVAAAAAAALVPIGSAAAQPFRVGRTQLLVAVSTPHVARSGPGLRAPALEVVQDRRPLTGERTVLPVLGRARGPQGVMWLRVRLPGRPNGHTGWIRQPGTVLTRTRWALVVDLESRRVEVYRRGRLVHSFAAVVGKPSTPTPRGRFFVEEMFPIAPGLAGSPYAIALSARSDVFSEFDGGPGQIALHGIDGIGGVPGTAASHGCVRLDSTDMDWLGTHIRDGVPVTIR